MAKKNQENTNTEIDLNNAIFHKDHKKPSSRREFLAQGFLGMSGSLLVPGILTMLSRRAMGAECAEAMAAGNGLPFMVFDHAGGCNFAIGNVLVGKAGGQTDFLDDAAVAKLGCPPDQNPKNNATMIDNELGLLFHKNSAWLAGFRSVTTAATRANMNGMVICARSGDDSNQNPYNPAFWIQKSGARGELVDIIGSGKSDSFGNARSPAEALSTASSALVGSPAQARSIVNTGLLGTLLPDPGQAEKVLKAAQGMSSSRLAAFAAKDIDSQVKELVACGYIKATDNLTRFTPNAVDPTQDPLVTQVLANNFAPAVNRNFTRVTTNDQKVATIAKLVLDGYAGVGTVEAGGYDYHNQGRTVQSQKDFNAGRNAGIAAELAAAKKKPLMMSFITDGGVSCNNTTADNSPQAAGRFGFQSDSGIRGSSFILVYSPKGRPELAGPQQVGAFTDGEGAVDQTFGPTGNNVTAASKVMVLNYLALLGRESEFDKIAVNSLGDTKPLIAFKKIV